MKRYYLLTAVLMPLLVGFDTMKSNIPVADIVSGGPPKDGIPALVEPKFVAAHDATYLQPEDRIIGVVRNGMTKAYPLRILNWHEAVNDTIGTTAAVVTYCPLTGSAVVYARTVNRQILSFGISGRLYQSNVLLYDHQTESLWSQLKEEAVTGPQTGTRLRVLPSITTTWNAWRRCTPIFRSSLNTWKRAMCRGRRNSSTENCEAAVCDPGSTPADGCVNS